MYILEKKKIYSHGCAEVICMVISVSIADNKILHIRLFYHILNVGKIYPQCGDKSVYWKIPILIHESVKEWHYLNLKCAGDVIYQK